jgi:hypothetical protein
MGSIVPLFGTAVALRWIGVERYKRAMYGCSLKSRTRDYKEAWLLLKSERVREPYYAEAT